MAASVIMPGDIVFAFAGGLLPALLWLWFWLKEDTLNPEPRGVIMRTFIAGMAAIPFAIFFEKMAFDAGFGTTVLIFVWAAIEEIFKFAAVYIAALRSRFADEAVDWVIYPITAALGFAALENMLFLWGAIENGEAFSSVFLTGNLRFIGATLLHVVSSASLGIAFAFAYHKKKKIRFEYALIGISTAIILHTLFNLFIIEQSNDGLFLIFSFVWVVAVVILVLFEKIKKIK
ncbi:PrsW family intramembrane metalloprotease [bacterium]|nr:PrsW family intramembrane metalloprotease [bacterium]MCI0565627.1 PrsW family intramembrane metalloprotease [bacterium]MCI0680383.1 PrsW family intramembrane metalloprotease [bacterium]